MSARARAAAQNAGLLVGSAALLLLVLEAAARLLFDRPPTVVVENLEREVAEEVAYEVEGSPNVLMVATRTGYRLRPNSRAVVRGHPVSQLDLEIRTNSLGYRHGELGEKREGDLRILVLGDSIMYGGYLPASLTIPRAIEARLRERRRGGDRGPGFEVINAAIGGLDLQNEFAILMETGLSVEPDVVLVGLYLNDAHESLYLEVTRLPALARHSALAALLLHRIDALRARYLVADAAGERAAALEREQRRFRETHEISDELWEQSEAGFHGWIDRAFHDWGYAWSPAYWEKVGGLLALMKGVGEDRGFALAVVLFPVRYQVQAGFLKDEPQRRFARLGADLGIAHLDLLPLLRARFAADGADLFYDYCHYTAEGAAFVGAQIAEFLLDEVL